MKRIQNMDASTRELQCDGRSVRSWRNLALTYSDDVQQHLVYRFMFISILSLGMAMVFFVLVLFGILAAIGRPA